MMDLASIKRSIYRDWEAEHVPLHVLAFCRFVSPKLRSELTLDLVESSVMYQQTAISGFKMACGEGGEEQFLDGADQLSGRTYFAAGRTERFAIDGIALLGVALGYHALRRSGEEIAWFLLLLENSISALSDDLWLGGLAKAARAVVLSKPFDDEVDAILSVSISSALGRQVCNEKRVQAWQSMIKSIEDDDPSRKAVFHGVYEASESALARLPVHGAGLTELVEILEGIAASMSHWTFETKPRVKNVQPEQWNMMHEYHVQNLLWTVLRPIFPELQDEESLKKLGHTTPRADLGIPSLGTIVEVKFLRGKGQSQIKKLTDEIAADHSLYLRDGTGYKSMIVFIWDECRQTEEYQTLKSGLESLEGVEKVILLPKPSKMGG